MNLSLSEGRMSAEEDLIKEAREGATSAFSQLVKRYEEQALRVAYSILGNWQDAEECAQDAFVKAFHGLKNFRAESGFFTWFYRILMNQCKDVLRKKKIRRHLSVNLKQSDDQEESPAEWRIPAREDTAQPLLNKEILGQIQQAVAGLAFQQKSVFTLRYLEGMSLKEIAGFLEISEGAVKAHLWNAVSKMKNILGNYLQERGDRL